MGALQGDDVRRLGGWLLVVLGLLMLVSVPVSLSGEVLSRPGVVAAGPGPWIGAFVPAFVLSGGVLIHLRPRNAIGWILLVSGLFQVTNLAADAYATRALTDADDSLPLGLPMAWLASWTWPPSLLLPMLVLPALYPTGRAESRYWRWHVRVSLVGIVLAGLAMASGPGGLDDTVAGTRLPWTAPVWTTYLLGVSAAVLLIAAAVSSIVGTFVRAWRASAPERQQLLWLISVVAVLVATTFNPPEILFLLSYTLIPVAVAVGVLRYGLLGIEVALRRTFLYVPLTVMVALVVGGLTTVLARLAPEGPLPLLAASAVVAVVLVPVAAWMRRAVDRLVLGERADPLAVVDRVGAGLEVEHDDPVASMLEAVASAADASYAVVRDQDGQLLAQVGGTGEPVLRVPLRHGGKGLGVLEVGAATGQRSPTGRDLRLVTALAPQLAVVVRSSRLTQDLARARIRVTRATLAERDRLRRDLHDGLGPSLSGIALGLEAASTAYDIDPDAIPELLQRTRTEADAAVREIRRVLDGLRPGSLDMHGLDGAVRDTASSLGMGQPGAPHFDLRSDLPPLLPPSIEEAAFRIAAESLTNVVRHSHAEHCAVRLQRANGDLRVQVSDDGWGLGLDQSQGHGLDSMRRRATDVGGSLTIDPADPTGTVVTAVLPLEAPA